MNKEQQKKKPIERVHIHMAGDRSVGIFSADFEMTIYLDLNCYSESDQQQVLEDTRKDISDLYERLGGQVPDYVLFDFELKQIDDSPDYP